MNRKERQFVNTVWQHYTEYGRHSLPWRKTTDPYRILVSEVMLQQTQVDRVLPKYQAFIQRWPTAQTLADASLGDVLKEWQGLGYNRRAKMLHVCAQTIIYDSEGMWPKTMEGLQQLPGVGPYTAGAVMAFAYNEAVSLIETNVRTVYLHHFFKNETDVTDAELVRLIALTLDEENPREWYWALMDYGAHLKKTHGNPNSRSRHYTKQSKFEGSDRQIRGAILRELTEVRTVSRVQLHKKLSRFEDVRIDAQLERLLAEELVVKSGRSYQLPR